MTVGNVELRAQLYPLRENWDLLKPFLNDKDVQKVLNEAMVEFCEQYPNAEKWIPGSAPWKYTTSDYWCNQIDEATQNDEKFQKEENELFEKLYGSDYDADDKDELWFEMWNTKEHCTLNNRYYDTYSPKEGTLEWYQFVHGCHWINKFTGALISKALNVEVNIWQTDTHTVATFSKNGIYYLADILNELTHLDSFDKLYDFMGEDIDYYPIFEDIA
ncbi:hypothetical protein V7037_05625 [Priestia megaterium]|uniref:hypothetical protein n=2 Tax=Priestia megaterium TaxID=1404 RepID=UPI003000E1B5